MNDKATEKNGKVIHNHSHSNISLLSDEKTPMKFPKVIDSISPISVTRSTKKVEGILSQNTRKLYSKTNFHKGSLCVPISKSPTQSYQSNEFANKPTYKRKINQNKRLNDNLTSASSKPKAFRKNPRDGMLNKRLIIEGTKSVTAKKKSSFRVYGN